MTIENFEELDAVNSQRQNNVLPEDQEIQEEDEEEEEDV